MKDRRAMDAPTVEHGKSSPKNADSEPQVRDGRAAFEPGTERFETRGELGRGGMGRVDDAYDHALGRQVAIKHVLSQAEIDLARFEREARITARLEHPGIVPVHDIGRGEDGTPYYVMRRVDGEPLSDIIADKPLADRLKLVPNLLAACDAAAFAHARGIVHRDIKPTNILVGSFGETLLIDWGLAREVTASEDKAATTRMSDSNLTRAGTVAGTPGFMSPEQARGETVDARADVFALGATLFYVLAGALPWHGGSTEMIDHVGAGRPPDWRLLPDEVPPDLRAIVEKAMALSLEQRYPDAGALAADLRRFTLGNLVAAYEYGFFARLARFVRRHRATVAVGVISLVVLAIVGIISVRRVIAERDDANAARNLAEMRQKEARAAADRLLVAHARELIDSDPVEAVAALRTLPADSPLWPQAWAVASGAFYKGIPFGFIGLDEPSFPMIAPDNAHAFVVGMMTGHLLIIDIAKRESRDVGHLGVVEGANWFDANHIVCVLRNEAILLDIRDETRRSLPGVANSYVYSNRQGRTVFEVEDRLFELDSVDAAPREIEHGITNYWPSPDLQSAVIARGVHRELQTPSKTYPMPDLESPSTHSPPYVVRENIVAALELPDAVIWDVKDDKLVERGRYRQPVATSGILMAEGVIFTASGAGYRRVDDNDRPVSGGDLATYVQTRTGMVMATNDGQIIIRDAGGTFRLGKRHALYARVDQSIDGSLLMATTLTGEILVWDLKAVRPRYMELDTDERPVWLTKLAVWTHAISRGYLRRDMATNTDYLVLELLTPISQFGVTEDERVIGALDIGNSRLHAGEKDVAVFADDHVASVGVGDHDLIYGKLDGDVWRWRGSTGATKVVTLSQPIQLIAQSSRYALGVSGDHDVFRIDLETGAQEHVQVAERVWRVALEPNGTAWLGAGDIPYRWRLAETKATALQTPEPIDGLVGMKAGAVFHTPHSLLVYETDEPRIIAKASKNVIPLDDGVVLATDPHGVISVIDIASGASFDLPLLLFAGVPVLVSAAPDLVGYISTQTEGGTMLFSLFQLGVPREPAALQKWLATITNAKPVANSEAVAWPQR